MHVVHVMLSLDVGGLERNVMNQVKQASRLKQRVTIICLERPGELANLVKENGAEVMCLNKAPGIKLGLVSRLKNILRELRPKWCILIKSPHYFMVARPHGWPVCRWLFTPSMGRKNTPSNSRRECWRGSACISPILFSA